MDIKNDIIFEDNHILLVNKKANMPSQADISDDLDLLSLLKTYIKKRDKKSGNVYLGLVHRIDRPVSGLMIFAKTSKAASRLSDQIRKKELKKTYLTLVEGCPLKQKDRLRHFLIKDKRKNKVRAFNKAQEASKEAILEYSVKKIFNGKTLLQINLITGRSHQIRCQLSAIGHPIYGDLKYGFDRKRKWNIKENGIALFSSELKFIHPTLKTECLFRKEPSWQINNL